MISLYIKILILLLPLSLMLCNAPRGETILLDKNSCTSSGRHVPDGDLSGPSDLARDALCSKKFIEKAAPDGVITIFGSARTDETAPAYKQTRTFAMLWTRLAGKKFPILTGGGHGIMEAANRGAKEAGGPSLSFGTFFGSRMTKPNKYTTAGYMFSSFSQRESEMVDRAAAIVVAPGGFGTEWEIFETLTKIQTHKIKKIPVVLLGQKEQWNTLIARIQYLKKAGTISSNDTTLITIASTPEIAVKILKNKLNISAAK